MLRFTIQVRIRGCDMVRENDDGVARKSARINDDAAVRAARKAVRGYVTLTEGAGVRVKEVDGRVVVDSPVTTRPASVAQTTKRASHLTP